MKTETGWRNCNLRTTFEKIIRRAGLQPWPRLWHNLRASAETDLVEFLPEHVACAYLGNSRTIAREHYLLVTDDHFQQALKVFSGALQNPVKYSAVYSSLDSQTEMSRNEKNPGISGVC